MRYVNLFLTVFFFSMQVRLPPNERNYYRRVQPRPYVNVPTYSLYNGYVPRSSSKAQQSYGRRGIARPNSYGR